jgi:hypothetical protein
MKVDTYIIVRDINPRGLPSLHRELFLGKPVLHHVIEKVQKIKSVSEVAILCETIDPFLENCAAVYGLRLHDSTLADIPRRDRFRRCRLWSANGWRGGLKYATVFDEDGWPAAATGVLEAFPCDLVYQVPAESLCLDPELSEDMLQHAMGNTELAKIVFHQASPGLLAVVYHREILLQMAHKALSLGDALAINNKGTENSDEVIGAGNFEVDVALSRNPWRFSADTSRQLKWLNTLVKDEKELSSLTATDWVKKAEENPFAAGPCRELEWEWVGEKSDECITDALFEKVLEEMRGQDDNLITIDGRGSWITHPKWKFYCQSLMKEACQGLHLRLNIKELNEERVSDLLKLAPTVISVIIDEAHDDEELLKLVDTLAKKRDPLSGHLMVVEMKRSKELIPHWEKFWDRWFDSCDQILWRYPAHHLHHFEEEGDLNLTRRFRAPCRKLFHELILRFDGRIPLCREDWADSQIVASFPENSIEEATKILQARWLAHREERYEGPCQNCEAWDRLSP